MKSSAFVWARTVSTISSTSKSLTPAIRPGMVLTFEVLTTADVRSFETTRVRPAGSMARTASSTSTPISKSALPNGTSAVTGRSVTL